MKYIQNEIDIIEELEKIKGYWDINGLDLYIAVVSTSLTTTHIIISTAHWTRVNYINVQINSKQVWEHLYTISDEIGRKFIRSTKGKYVYINKLNLQQTQDIFDTFKNKFGTDVCRVWEMKWDINGSELPHSYIVE